MKYGIWTNQYLDEKFYGIKHKDDRKQIASKYLELNEIFDRRNKFLKFLHDYGDRAFKSPAKQKEYIDKFYWFFNDGKSSIGSNLQIIGHAKILRDHMIEPFAHIHIGNNFKIYKGVYIDYCGGLEIGDNVGISENVIIYTHYHDNTHRYTKCDKTLRGKIIPSSLVIGDGVGIGARAIIQSECHSIGRCAMIGAGAVVRSNIPPYAIVLGNPAKVVGFVLTPEEIIQYEKNVYPEEQRLCADLLEKNYNKYFSNRIKEIRNILR